MKAIVVARFRSRSDASRTYRVLGHADAGPYTCECAGFRYRGRCRHVRAVELGFDVCDDREGERDERLLELIQRLDLEPLTWRDAQGLERESAVACKGCGANRRVFGLEVCATCWSRAKEVALLRPGGRERGAASTRTKAAK